MPGAVSNGGNTSTLDFTTFKHCINAELVDTKLHRNGINPANLAALPDVPVATEEDLDKAVAAARVAFKSWSKVSWEDRKKTLLAFIDALEAEQEGFTKLLTTEQGKPVSCCCSSRDKLIHCQCQMC